MSRLLETLHLFPFFLGFGWRQRKQICVQCPPKINRSLQSLRVTCVYYRPLVRPWWSLFLLRFPKTLPLLHRGKHIPNIWFRQVEPPAVIFKFLFSALLRSFLSLITTSLPLFLLEPSTYAKSLAMMSRQQAPLAHNKDFYFFFFFSFGRHDKK